jgi:hypothetical protein
MDRDKLYETSYWVEDITTGAPHVASRWESHEPAPGYDHPKVMSAGHTPFQYGMPHAQAELPHRPHQQLFQESEGSNSISPESTAGRLARDGEQHQEDEAAETLMDDEEDVEEIPFGDTHPGTVYPDPPLQRLLLDTRSADVQDFGQWYFLSQMPAKDREFFSGAQQHWVKGTKSRRITPPYRESILTRLTALWEMSRVNQPMYAIMGSFALYKKSVFSGKAKAAYIEQKGRVIQDIVANINANQVAARNAPDSLTLVAIAVLGYLDIRDGHFEAAATHIRAVSKFVDMPSLSPHAWLYCVWIDLRFALFTGQEPQLPFYIPAEYRDLPQSVLSCQREANRLGNINAANCPRSPLFTLDMASDLYRKLHALCYCSDVLTSSENPPFGQVYALEYGLRVIQARASRSQGDVFTSHVVMLLTSAIQLHVWMASRFWTPQRKESHLALITRACKVIESFDDMVTQWYISAGLESLLWVLFTLVATLNAHGILDNTPLLELLYRAIRKADIYSCEDLELRLKKWPWLKNWHLVQIKHIWERMCVGHADLVPLEPGFGSERRLPYLNKAQDRWFVGGLEFFNSL